MQNAGAIVRKYSLALHRIASYLPKGGKENEGRLAWDCQLSQTLTFCVDIVADSPNAEQERDGARLRRQMGRTGGRAPECGRAGVKHSRTWINVFMTMRTQRGFRRTGRGVMQTAIIMDVLRNASGSSLPTDSLRDPPDLHPLVFYWRNSSILVYAIIRCLTSWPR